VGVFECRTPDHITPIFGHTNGVFQLISQVSGRAGRKNKRGKVVLQNQSTRHPVMPARQENAWEKLFTYQLSERKCFAIALFPDY
jgi:primosomal protein N' (replication factor Y)